MLAPLLRRLAPALWRIQVLIWTVTRAVTLGVKVIAFTPSDEVLLVRHTYRVGWHLPGGAVRRRESFAAAARRELREETGLAAGALELRGLYWSVGRFTSHIAVFATTVTAEPRSDSWEIARCELFPVANLPRDVARADRERIEELVERRPPGSGRW